MTGFNTFLRYRPFDDEGRTFGEIESGHIYFAERSQLNDPSDCNADILALTNELLKLKGVKGNGGLKAIKRDPSAIKEFNKKIGTLGIACFSESLYNKKMWSTYADNDSGVCIAYRLPENYLNNGKVFFGCDRVDYTTQRLANWLRSNGLLFKRDRKRFIKNLAMIYTTTKDPCWTYEEEIRVLRQNFGLLQLPENSIIQIAFGVNAKDENIAKVKDIVKNKEITLCKMTRSVGEDILCACSIT